MESIPNPEFVVIKGQPKSHANLKGKANFRGSIFRGVSKNKGKWQMMIMTGLNKLYLGAIESEEEAARIYDKYAILHQGMKAKTNFTYTKYDILDILNETASSSS